MRSAPKPSITPSAPPVPSGWQSQREAANSCQSGALRSTKETAPPRAFGPPAAPSSFVSQAQRSAPRTKPTARMPRKAASCINARPTAPQAPGTTTMARGSKWRRHASATSEEVRPAATSCGAVSMGTSMTKALLGLTTATVRQQPASSPKRSRTNPTRMPTGKLAFFEATTVPTPSEPMIRGMGRPSSPRNSSLSRGCTLEYSMRTWISPSRGGAVSASSSSSSSLLGFVRINANKLPAVPSPPIAPAAHPAVESGAAGGGSDRRPHRTNP
mmetsp:Transcript_67132/g.143647  ORF Transcript_67132/g.143647 Transcript_67132/m.143647 type:complete len:272 (-) Transcript_67132:9-824(-)